MGAGAPPLDPGFDLQGQRITALMRWAALCSGLLGLFLAWDSPAMRPGPVLGLLCGYAVFMTASHAWQRRHPRSRELRWAHAVVDAATIGLGAALSGGLASLYWLLLFPHVLAFSVRARPPLGVMIGVLDAAIVLWLASLGPPSPLGIPGAGALLLCGIVGGIVGSHLRRVQHSLRLANRGLAAANAQLSEALAAQQAGQQQQAAALARLQDSEDRYRRLLQRIQDGVVIVQQGRVAYANDVFAAMMGASPEALVGRSLRECVPPEDRKRLVETYRHWEQAPVLSGSLETRLLTRAGEGLLVSVRAGALEAEGRRSVIATVRDITGQRRMEQEIKAHAERLAAINEIANAVNLSLTIEDILAVAAQESRRLVPFDRLSIALLEEGGGELELVAVEPRPRRVHPSFGLQQAAWAFKRPASWCAGNDEPPPHAAELLAEERILAVATLPLVSKDRTIGSLNLGRFEARAFSAWELGVMEPVARHIAIALSNARLLEALRRRSGELQSVMEVCRGITERLDLAELLPLVTRSVNRVMGTRHCILMLRQDDRLVVAAEEGVEPEVLQIIGTLKIGQSLSGWVAQAGRPLAVTNFREDPRALFPDVSSRYGYASYLGVPLKHGAEILGTLEVVTKQRRHFGAEEQELMAAFAAQAAVAIGHARLFESTRSHLAQLEEANRRLEELDRLRQQYLRNVSHEFRSPLTVIKGYAEYLHSEGEQEPGGLRDVMRIIMESSDRLIDLVDTLLEVSRVERGIAERELRLTPLDLRDVAAAAAALLRPVAFKKGVAMDTDFPDEPLQFEGDAGLLQQLVRKLLDNAVKYSPSGGRVVLIARHEPGALVLEVQDSGIGIPPEHLPRIFEKFYMVEGGIARRWGGTGMGLYLVREIARLHGGTVDVRSVPGSGSVFSARFPRLTPGDRTRSVPA